MTAVRARRAFTLIELLLVVGVLVALSAIALPYGSQVLDQQAFERTVDDTVSQAMSARHAETARRYQREATEQRDEDVSRIDAGLSAYATATNYAKNIESVVLQQLEEIIVIADQIDARNNSRRINNRKSMFLDIQRSSLYQWDARLTGTIWILALAYARESGAFVSINPVAWLIVSGLVVSPWVIGWVSWLVGKKVPRFNVYTTFTE